MFLLHSIYSLCGEEYDKKLCKLQNLEVPLLAADIQNNSDEDDRDDDDSDEDDRDDDDSDED